MDLASIMGLDSTNTIIGIITIIVTIIIAIITSSIITTTITMIIITIRIHTTKKPMRIASFMAALNLGAVDSMGAVEAGDSEGLRGKGHEEFTSLNCEILKPL
jgi:hypothetical protein